LKNVAIFLENSLNGDLLEKQRRNKKYVAFKFNTKKPNSIPIKTYSIEKLEK
jgi:hypothetical protein